MKERMVCSWAHISCAVFLSLLIATPVFAAIPLITDDTGTQGKGKFQVELFGEYGHDKEERVTSNNSDLSAALTYGLIDPIDIVLSVPYQVWRTDDSDSVATENGIGDLAFEATWRISEIGDWSFALKPGLTIPTGSDSRGLGAWKATYHVFSIAAYNAGEERFAPEGRRIERPEEKALHHAEWSAYCSATYTRNENSIGERMDLWSFSAAGSVEFIEDFYVVADLGAQTNTDAASSTCPAYFLTGFIYSPAENMDLGLGVIFGLNSAEADYSVRDGITFRF